MIVCVFVCGVYVCTYMKAHMAWHVLGGRKQLQLPFTCLSENLLAFCCVFQAP